MKKLTDVFRMKGVPKIMEISQSTLKM